MYLNEEYKSLIERDAWVQVPRFAQYLYMMSVFTQLYNLEQTSLTPEQKQAREQLVLLKIAHEIDVIFYTQFIITESNFQIEGQDTSWNVQQAIAIAALHDIERIREAVEYGSYDRTKTGFKHAFFGSLLFAEWVAELSNNQFLEKNGFDWEIICNAIEYHDAKDFDPTNASPYLKLIRDADKLANYKSYPKKAPEEPICVISQEVIQEFSEGHLIGHDHVHSEADYVVYILAWLFDINFEASKRILVREGYIKQLYDLLVNFSIEEKQLKTIREILLKVWNDNTTTAVLPRDYFMAEHIFDRD